MNQTPDAQAHPIANDINSTDESECDYSPIDSVLIENAVVEESNIGNVHLSRSTKNTFANKIVYNAPINVYQRKIKQNPLELDQISEKVYQSVEKSNQSSNNNCSAPILKEKKLIGNGILRIFKCLFLMYLFIGIIYLFSVVLLGEKIYEFRDAFINTLIICSLLYIGIAVMFSFLMFFFDE